MAIERIIRHIASRRRQRQATMSLATLSERQLDDLGIARQDLFAARRSWEL